MPEAERTITSRPPILWKIVLGGVVFAGVFIWISSVLDLGRVWQTFRSANYWLVLASAVPVVASHWMRAVRWKTMLRAVEGLPRLSLHDLFSAVMVGYVANNLVPRSGEVLRPYVLARRYRLSSALVLASVFAERSIDVLQLLFFLACALYLLPEIATHALPQWLIGEGARTLALMVLVFAAIGVLIGFSSAGERIILRIIRVFSVQAAERVHGIFDAFRRGIRVIRHPADAGRILLESLAIWVLYVLPLWIVMAAVPMHAPAKFAWTFWDGCIVLLVVAVATTVAPTPGAIGVVHALVAEAMYRLYQVPIEEAFVFITIAHAINYVTVMLVGAGYVVREGVSLISFFRPGTTLETGLSATGQTSA
ncbi:MAG: lysylphosphatidylglycerol synthase transmembrane domain-containing protein [Bacteroidota bacterium]|nr:flippase-like domain-containing protein [Candidatus Kapabacteria bacterium]MCS7302384.1 flippase-like domain-containing protein [Candidatus Kapabacteria bacterium]MCX7936474.1 flippase-like domain-containing protein [Chlorobiota bacterium]MDW8074635.1 lysylphosphatidylglycerol synthase transmembrane domain-containing protein [Bacteroidota bacterium]MDW8270889.1 lysylphosphatidylglycerol synthase transmembrane domain-containing protein [Bacteroidota bacterium]